MEFPAPKELPAQHILILYPRTYKPQSNTIAYSVDIRTGQEEEDEEIANIWTADEVINATASEIVDYITSKINNYNKKELKGINLFEY